MTHASSEEEIKAMRSDFGLRLSSSMAQYGPLVRRHRPAQEKPH